MSVRTQYRIWIWNKKFNSQYPIVSLNSIMKGLHKIMDMGGSCQTRSNVLSFLFMFVCLIHMGVTVVPNNTRRKLQNSGIRVTAVKSTLCG